MSRRSKGDSYILKEISRKSQQNDDNTSIYYSSENNDYLNQVHRITL